MVKINLRSMNDDLRMKNIPEKIVNRKKNLNDYKQFSYFLKCFLGLGVTSKQALSKCSNKSSSW